MSSPPFSHSISIERISGDETILSHFTYLALYVTQGQEPFPMSILEEDKISHSFKEWGKHGDIGFSLRDQKIIGAAWVRLHSAKDPGYGYVDDDTPELVMAVENQYRGKQLGSLLLKHLIREVKAEGFTGISLSVDSRNPAIHLYRKMGFLEVNEDINPTMLLRF